MSFLVKRFASSRLAILQNFKASNDLNKFHTSAFNMIKVTATIK
jgi:hypothetical protein